MKKTLKKALCLALAAVLAALCCACGDETVKAERTDEGFKVDSTGIEYIPCGALTLYAVGKGEFYTEITAGKAKETVYTVEFEDPKEYLCVEDEGEFLLYRSKELGELDILSFDPIAALIYNNSNRKWIASFYADDEYLPEDQRGINETQDTAICKAIADAIANGESVRYNESELVDTNNYFIRLTSAKYPGLYYLVAFFPDVNGRFYLRDRGANKTVYCPKEVTARMIGGSVG